MTTDEHGNPTPIIIEDNTISSSISREGAIRVHATVFTIKDNNIHAEMVAGGGEHSGVGIRTSANTIKHATIENNTIYSEGIRAIYLDSVDADGYLLIKNNNVTQNYANPTDTRTTMIYLNKIYPTSMVYCEHNKFTFTSGRWRFTIPGNSSHMGSIIYYIDNTLIGHNGVNHFDINTTQTKIIESGTIPSGSSSGMTLQHINAKSWSINPSYNAKGDGVTDDTVAIQQALKKAQDDGVALFFPAGTYVCDGNTDINLNSSPSDRTGKNIHIVGQGRDSTKIVEPGTLRVWNDLTIENITIQKTSGIFAYILRATDTGGPLTGSKPYANLTVKNSRFVGTKIGDDCRFFYAVVPHINTSRGINHIQFTNNKAQYFRSLLQANCEVNSGFIDGNTLTDMGDPTVRRTMRGLAVGTTDSANRWVMAKNVTISNNYIKGVYAAPRPVSVIDDDEDDNISEEEDENTSGTVPPLVYSIIGVGENITIENNHVENQDSFTAIYSKANNLVIRGNTIINAGDRSSICVKVNGSENSGTSAGNVLVEDNNISSNMTLDASVRIHAKYFTVRGNRIYQYDEATALPKEIPAIIHKSDSIKDIVIEDNEIYSETKFGIELQSFNDNSTALIKNNTIVHNVLANGLADCRTIYPRSIKATSVITVEGNDITLERGRYCLYTGSAAEGSVLNFFENEVIVEEGFDIIYNYNNSLRVNVNANNFTYNYNNPNGDAALFRFPAPFTMTYNTMTFGDDAQINRVITCTTPVTGNVGVTTTIANNVVDGRLDGSIAVGRSFIVISAGTVNPYWQMNIYDNDVTVLSSLIYRGSTSTPININGTINIDRNTIRRNLSVGSSTNGVYGATDRFDSSYVLGTGPNANTIIQI